MLAALFQLEQSQWWSPAAHWVRQREQLALLLRHAIRTCPYYAQAIGATVEGFAPEFSETDFRALPILRRADLQTRHEDIASRGVPREHGPVSESATSGSTGEPVRFRSTQLAGFYWQAFNLRDHLWHRRDFSRKLVTVRSTGEAARLDNWFGEIGDTTLETGPCVVIAMDRPIAAQAASVVAEAPAYLTGYPNHLMALLKQIDATGGSLPGLSQLRTFGEPVTEAHRRYVTGRWGVPLIDLYSTRETGYLALQCPDGEGYHVQSESVYLEVLDASGQPCTPGESGRVVVTPLHNFAYPLVRYELGDHAEVGEPCACGRGLPVIRRILGRSRNLAKLRDGRSFWPTYGVADLLGIAPIRQFQFVQTGYDDLEVRLVVARDLTDGERENLSAHLLEQLGHPFRLHWRFMAEIPYNNGGKFEDFIRAFDD
jgi:phenylacetate-CoA ligase